ncbi:chloramphenicol resistance protein [Penicillium canariense]|uniref:Chloramphenicol resistance protein n=1 Tax=Penicillium canariense TaxID=189055 RepID=A0A9W9IGI6_9EURO|nr:chloramphenicol resistance protein [Penicillium canariense]KAJ5177144.1 chloramphenicol resistance protein [Penicillium canariense]
MASPEKVLVEAPTPSGVPDRSDQSNNLIERHSVFTVREKWCIVAMVSYAAWFSTLSSFIYYPAIPTLSKSLDVSVSKINLTVTTYMAIASIAPALVGDTADILGRRPVYILVLIMSAFISGRKLDQAWLNARIKRGLPIDKAIGDDLDNFPVEKARLCVIWVPMLMTTGLVVAFGWVLHYHQHIAIPLVIQFFAGLCMQLDFSVSALYLEEFTTS